MLDVIQGKKNPKKRILQTKVYIFVHFLAKPSHKGSFFFKKFLPTQRKNCIFTYTMAFMSELKLYPLGRGCYRV
ncbi:hypothetical protein R83H12_00035 [Fibrobacteria bacterium R8-3-H12]